MLARYCETIRMFLNLLHNACIRRVVFSGLTSAAEAQHVAFRDVAL